MKNFFRRLGSGRKACGSHRTYLQVERLDDRTVPSTFTASNLLDSGLGSLRQAILDANATRGDDGITFDSTVFSGPKIITLTSGELDITDTTGRLTITGPAAGLTISGSKTSRVFGIGAEANAVISGLTIASGKTTASLTQTVDPVSTATSLTSSANPSVYGQAVTFTATVARRPGIRHPHRHGDLPGRGDDPGHRDARRPRRGHVHHLRRCTASASHSITATYNGDEQFHHQHLGGADPDGQPGDDDDTAGLVGQSLGLRPIGDLHGDGHRRAPGPARPPARSPSLTASAILGTGAKRRGGDLHHLGTLGVGSHTITAVYSGDANFTTSTSASLTQTVNPARRRPRLASSANPSVFGQSVTFTATVAPSARAPARPPAR